MTFEQVELETDNVSKLRTCLLNEKSPLSTRFRALFTLKSINSEDSIRAIEEAFDEKASALLNHELAYVLGQMKNELAIPKLTEILSSPGHAVGLKF
jgi:deoxyhypusine monooxygenase